MDAYPDLVQLNTGRILLDGVGRELLEGVVSDHLAALGTALTVFEANGDYATGGRPHGWCRVMDELSLPPGDASSVAEAIASGRWSCRANCRRPALEAMATGAPADFQCLGGLRVHASPIRVEGEIVGSISVGVGGPPLEEGQLRTLAESLGTSVERLQREAGAARAVPLEAQEIACRSVDVTARLLGEMVGRDRRRELYTGMIAHDLRNPLFAIGIGVESMRRSVAPDSPAAKPLEVVNRGAVRMSRLVEDLLDLTRVNLGGGIPLRVQSLSLAGLVSEALADARLVHPRHVIRFHDAGDTTFEGDRDRLREVIENLLENAIRYSRESPVDIEVSGSPDEVVLRVHNGGPPIPASELPTIFDPFRRGIAARTGERSGGLGLGLFIAREFVRAHQGTIDVESGNEGTTFSVRLQKTRDA